MDIILKGLLWVQDGVRIQNDIRIKSNVIHEIGSLLVPKKSDRVLTFSNHFAYPGLINAHDHLEMNLYAKLGNPPYHNYTEWAQDIYKPRESPIREIERVPINDRLLWGGLKNLISGVTTVVHHNPWKRILASDKFPVKVLKRMTWAHSLAFEKSLVKSFPRNKRVPFVIHAAEGIDALAHAEIKKLHALSMVKSNTVLVHAVASSDQDIDLMQQAGAAVVWCPASNFYLFNQTAPVAKLKDRISVSLGSDSTLTGSRTLLEEMGVAYQTGLVTAAEILNMVTYTPASIFHLNEPSIKIGCQADLLIAPIKRTDYYENLISTMNADIELIMVNGKVGLSSVETAGQLDLNRNFAKINGIQKWLCLNVQALKERIRNIASSVVEASPLWDLID